MGTGFTDAALADLHRQLAPLAQERSGFGEPVPSAEARMARWVRPVLVGEVVYRTLTHDRRLRHAAWRGLCPDRDAEESKPCTAADPPSAGRPHTASSRSATRWGTAPPTNSPATGSRS